MTSTALNANARLSDELERDLLRSAMGQRKPVGPAAKSPKLKRVVRGFLGMIDSLNDATSRVRAQSARLGGAHW